ncbi:MAG: hypothetical protein JNK02_13670 [Planctomycetes bacterium]|nr:hypothetical protein [Planctomycetota bacterium]
MTTAGPAKRRATWWIAGALALMVALAAIAREVGLDFQLPTAGLADERVYIEHVAAFESGVENPSALPGAATYPYLVSKLALATWRKPRCTSADVDEHLDAAASLAVHIRRVVALLSLLSIPAMWLLVRAFSPPATALLAAALCGSSVFAQAFAQQARPHGASFGLCLLALALAVHLQRRPTFARALLTGTAAGLAFAALQSGIAMLVPVAVAILLARGIGMRRRAELFGTALLPTAALFAWAYHYLFVEHIDRGAQPGHALLGEGAFRLDMLTGAGFPTFVRALWTYEPIAVVVALVAAAAGTALAWRSIWSRGHGTTEGAERRVRLLSRLDPRTWSDTTRSAAVVGSYLVPYVVVFGLYDRTYPRYALPLVPFLAWAGAWILVPRAARLGQWQAWIPATLVVGAQAGLVAKLAWVRAQPDTLELAADWIEHEAPPGARVGLLPGDDLPLLRPPEQRLELRRREYSNPHRHWLAYQARLEPGPWDVHARELVVPERADPERLVNAFVEGGADYCVVRTFQHMRVDGLQALRRALERSGSRVASFCPVDEPEPAAFVTRDEFQAPDQHGPWVWRLARAERTGNVVEIWKLDRRR